MNSLINQLRNDTLYECTAAYLCDDAANEIERLLEVVRVLEEENERLMSENHHVSYYHQGWPEVMEAYKRGRAGAVEDLTYVGDLRV